MRWPSGANAANEGLRLQQKEKVRVYALARELDVDTKHLLDLCKQAGYDVKNQLSGLEHEQVAHLKEMIKRGAAKAPAQPAQAKPVTPVLTPEARVVRNLTPARPKREAEAPRTAIPAVTPTSPRPAETPAAAQAPSVPAPALEVPAAAAAQAKPAREEAPSVPTPPPAPAAPQPQAPAAEKPSVEKPTPPAAPAPSVTAPPTPAPSAVPPSATPPVTAAPSPKPPETRPPETRPIASPPTRVPTLPGSSRPTPRPGIAKPPRKPELHPGIAARAVSPPPLRPLKPVAKKPEEKVLAPIARFTQDQLQAKKPLRPEDVLKPEQVPGYVEEVEETEEERGKGKKPKGVVGREDRKKARNKAAAERKARQDEELRGGKLLTVDEDGPVKTLHKIRAKAKQRPITLPRKGKTVLELPLTIRDLSEALGVRSVELLFKLRDHGAPPNININSIVDQEQAEYIALEYGAELEFRKPADAEDHVLASFEKPDQPEELQPRAPIVTIMGHVDHGKTSLLDKIRQSNVAATEAGGITQVIRAWRVEHGDRPITFLDTPGHEAFTKMRARGAQVTDIAVIVVAADDGVMPQTKEAIQHARAAGVSLVVAINKVDLPNANVTKTRQMLYAEDVLPDNMGGDTPFVETSAATGKGIDDLLDAISLVAELKELKANPNKPGRGTCLEAMLSEGEGVRATLLVRDGTLRRGDVLLCGHTYGRVRQMYDDLGRPLEEAGPSVPVRITGLDEVPNADDAFVVLPDLGVAREIAEKRKHKLHEASQTKRPTLSLEKLSEAKIAELKVILKADFRGSIEAIRKELEKLQHEEVRVRLLETGIGKITETDVWLALASPEDTMIIGFNAVPDDAARALAEEKGIQIREYNIIYNLTNDIRAALEGKLKPREEVIHLGRAVVRETFKISRVGTIAGCYVTQGTIRRNAKVRVIREGVIVYPPADRSVGLDSLKRFKEDVSEVREGFECGIKVAGYDDIKVGDVIEAYRVEQVQRTL